MLRVLAISSLVSGLCCPAYAQTLPLRQNGVNNYAIIAPGDISSDIEISQTGRNNLAVDQQNGPDNSIYVNQRAKNSNTSIVNQYGIDNIAVVVQQYNFRPVGSPPTSYVGQQTSYGYLSEFISGGVSILALTGSGNTLVSSFGRSH
ncbi:MAG: hypothetical protein ABR878_06260 [Roseiarcus sp.]|jgi:hypothetical protein